MVAAAAVVVWAIAAYAVHQYDAWKEQGLAGDLALTSVLALGVTAAVVVPGALPPAYVPVVRPSHFLAVLWAGALWLRTIIPGVRAAVDAPMDVVIVGAGLLARHTGIQIRDERSHRELMGYLSFAGEEPDARLHAPVLGEASDLERVLRERALDEVYLAGNALHHARRCRRPSASASASASRSRSPRPGSASPARDPASARAVPDGYVHYLTVANQAGQLSSSACFDIAVSGVALALLVAAVPRRSRSPSSSRRAGPCSSSRSASACTAAVQHAQVPLDGAQRRGAQGAALGAERAERPRLQDEARPARHAPSGASSASSASTSSRSSSTCSAARCRSSAPAPRPARGRAVRGVAAPPPVGAPGLTCVWQVSGRNEISFEEWMYLDMQYIDHWSLAQDLELILKTVPAVLTGRGAS